MHTLRASCTKRRRRYPRFSWPASRHLAHHKAGPGADGPPAVEPADTRTEEIRALAFAFYVSRGSEAGHELDDWLRAEAEVNAKSATPASH